MRLLATLALVPIFGCGSDAPDAAPWMPTGATDSGEQAQDDTAGDGALEGSEDETADAGSSATTGPATDADDGSTEAGDPPPLDTGAEESTGEPPPPVDPPPFLPLYRIELRIHMSNSALTDDEVLDYLTEMNFIWRSQAGICFEVEIVDHDDPMTTGYDLWFQPEVNGYNGYYYGDHEIYVRDYPSLSNAPNPAQFQGARTTAHELGHGLTLSHDQGSDDYLMRSGTQGWQIPMVQIDASRNRAADKALPDTTPEDCAPISE